MREDPSPLLSFWRTFKDTKGSADALHHASQQIVLASQALCEASRELLQGSRALRRRIVDRQRGAPDDSGGAG